ncbi:Pseudouridine kinase, partial [Stylophora pistillata]
ESQGKVPGFPDSTTDWNRQKRPVVIGGSNVDFIATAENIVASMPEASNPGKVRMSFGGVGRNMAECLARLGLRPLFVSSIGSDPLGAMLLKHCEETRMVTRGIYTSKVNHTGTYSAIMSQNGEFHAAVGDMDIHKVISPDHILAFEEPIKHAPLVMLDGNITEEAIDQVCYFCAANRIPVWFEPTCVLKADKPFRSDAWHNITYVSPNLKELQTMSSATINDELRRSNLPHYTTEDDNDKDRPLDDIIAECLHLCKPLLKNIHCIIVTLGKHGALICRDTSADTPFPTAQQLGRVSAARQHSLVSARHFPAIGLGSHEPGGNVTGAGDSFAAAMASFIIQGHSPVICVKAGILAAQYSLQSQDAISPAVFPENFTLENVESCIPWDANDIDTDIS